MANIKQVAALAGLSVSLSLIHISLSVTYIFRPKINQGIAPAIPWPLLVYMRSAYARLSRR